MPFTIDQLEVSRNYKFITNLILLSFNFMESWFLGLIATKTS